MWWSARKARTNEYHASDGFQKIKLSAGRARAVRIPHNSSRAGPRGRGRGDVPAGGENGREVTDVFLEFSKGKVVRAEAAKGQDYLHAMIAMDPGASYLGEAAVGTNYNITQYTRNTLFDEKIGGTVHLALGSSYPETGSANTSGLHWDMVCDMRTKGAIYADGALIQKNGRFCDKRFPQPPRRRKK